MEYAAGAARFGNRILNIFVTVLILLMLAFGGYSLWYSWSVSRGAFLSGDLMQYKPQAAQAGANPTLEELMAVNPDVVGWLTVDGTNIDYPMVQGETDMEYINKDVYGDFSLSGAIFLSCLNSPDFSDPYNLVYGHHMSSGAMFGNVVQFTDAAYFEEHQAGTLYLPDATFRIELFACLETDAYDSMIYNVQAGENNGERLSYLKGLAIQYRDIDARAEDSVIALSTCAEAETNGRVILFGRLTEME